MTPSREAAQGVLAARQPTDEEIDVFGLTHPGLVRTNNQDHFLICSLRRQVQIVRTSLPDDTRWPAAERLAFLAMVADGVGGSSQGEEASRLAVEDRIPPRTAAPRIPVTMRLHLDDLAEILPPGEQMLLDHLRARRPLKALDGIPGFQSAGVMHAFSASCLA